MYSTIDEPDSYVPPSQESKAHFPRHGSIASELVSRPLTAPVKSSSNQEAEEGMRKK